MFSALLTHFRQSEKREFDWCKTFPIFKPCFSQFSNVRKMILFVFIRKTKICFTFSDGFYFEYPNCDVPKTVHCCQNQTEIPRATIYLLNPRLLPEGPVNTALSVRPSVRPSIYNALFLGLPHYFFLNFCMNLGFSKISSFVSPKWGKWAILGAKFYLNLFIKYLWNCAWLQALKGGLKWLVWIFKENYYYSQHWVNK